MEGAPHPRDRQPANSSSNKEHGIFPPRVTLLTVREHQRRRRERESRGGIITRTGPTDTFGSSLHHSSSNTALLQPTARQQQPLSRSKLQLASPRTPLRVGQHQQRDATSPRPLGARGLGLALQSPSVIVLKKKCWWNNVGGGVIQRPAQLRQQQQQQHQERSTRSARYHTRQGTLQQQRGRGGAWIPGTESRKQAMSSTTATYGSGKSIFGSGQHIREPRPPPIICPSPTGYACGKVPAGGEEGGCSNSFPVTSVTLSEASSVLVRGFLRLCFVMVWSCWRARMLRLVDMKSDVFLCTSIEQVFVLALYVSV